MAGETEHTIRFVIPKTDDEAWDAYEHFVQMLEEKGYLRRDGFTHAKPATKAARVITRAKREAE